MSLNELIKISINGLKENYNMTDVNEVVKAIKEKVSKGMITKEVAFDMLQGMSKQSTPEVKMKHILTVWENIPSINKMKLENVRLQEIKEQSRYGLKHQDIRKVQYEELKHLINNLNFHIRYNNLNIQTKERIIDRFIKNTETLYLSNDDIQEIRGNEKELQK